jgi:hypothetical protein
MPSKDKFKKQAIYPKGDSTVFSLKYWIHPTKNSQKERTKIPKSQQ